MLGNLLCWIVAIAAIFSNGPKAPDLETRLLYAMGFIFLGILSKTSDYYKDVHKSAAGTKKD